MGLEVTPRVYVCGCADGLGALVTELAGPRDERRAVAAEAGPLGRRRAVLSAPRLLRVLRVGAAFPFPLLLTLHPPLPATCMYSRLVVCPFTPPHPTPLVLTGLAFDFLCTYLTRCMFPRASVFGVAPTPSALPWRPPTPTISLPPTPPPSDSSPRPS